MLLHCRLIVGLLTNDMHKLLDTQSLLMYHSVVKVVKKLQAAKLSFKAASAYVSTK